MMVVKKRLDSATTLQSGWALWSCHVCLPLWLLLQLTGFFWLPSTHSYKVVVANLLLLSSLLVLFSRSAWRAALHSRIFILILIYFVYMSALPFVYRNEDPLACARWCLYLLLYVFVIGYRLQMHQDGLRVLVLLSAATCATAITYGIGRDIFFQHGWSSSYRFVGYASLYNSLRSGHLFGFFAIAALWLSLAREGSFLRRWAAGVIAVICLLGAVVTGSRSPLVGIAFAGFYLIYFATPASSRKSVLAIGATIFAGICVVFWSQLIERGLSYRPQIWMGVIGQWRQSPWFGFGYNAHPIIKLDTISDVFYDTHNIVLAVLYKGGLVGVLLFAAIHLTAFVQAFQLRKLSSEAVLAGSLMIYGMAALQFDGGSIFGRPNEFWLLLWFPIALLFYVQRNGGGLEMQERKPA